MNSYLLKNVIGELNDSLKGGIVSKIHQPDDRMIILRIFVRGREERLVISASPKSARLHLTDESYVNPPTPKRFCAYLRSRITDARIEEFRHIEGERIARIELKKRRDDSFEHLTLIAELTGKSSNIILTDDKNAVLDSIRYFLPEESVRAVVPGITLAALPPPPEGVREEAFEKEEGISWNEAAKRHYVSIIEKDEFTIDKGRLRRIAAEAGKKLKRKLDNLNGDKAKAEKELGYGAIGELLIANFGKIKKGMKEVEATDYTKYPSEEVKVALDEKLGPKENAEKYFKRAKKAKAALALLKDRLPAVEEELQYIEGLLYDIEDAGTLEDLGFIEDDLREGGYIKRMPEKEIHRKTAEERTEPIRRATSSEGFELLCGKSGTGNDLIVKKHAKDEDIWFHAAKVPGSHCLIKVAGRGKELTKKTIEEAASFAAWHSKVRDAMKVEVIYAEARHVKKPRGAKPGMVTVKEYKSIMVKPKDLEAVRGPMES